MKRKALCVLVSVLLLAALLLAACGGTKYSVLSGARLEDCTLTVHYIKRNVCYLVPYSLRDFLEEDQRFGERLFLYHVTVPGTELKENEQFLALLEMLDGQELPPVQDITNYWDILPKIYYSLTDQDGERLFDVGICWDNFSDDDPGTTETVYFNGEKIPYDELFDLCVEPYMTYPQGED